MKIDELIKLLQKKKEEHWDWVVSIKKYIYYGDYEDYEIKNVRHNWEAWISIYI